MVLDSQSYQFQEADSLYQDVQVVANHFRETLIANGCQIDKLKDKFDVLYDHIYQYVAKSTLKKCWSNIFNI